MKIQEIDFLSEIRPRVIRGRNELRGRLYDESENYTKPSSENQLPPLSQLLCASKKNYFTEVNSRVFLIKYDK